MAEEDRPLADVRPRRVRPWMAEGLLESVDGAGGYPMSAPLLASEGLVDDATDPASDRDELPHPDRVDQLADQPALHEYSSLTDGTELGEVHGRVYEFDCDDRTIAVAVGLPDAGAGQRTLYPDMPVAETVDVRRKRSELSDLDPSEWDVCIAADPTPGVAGDAFEEPDADQVERGLRGTWADEVEEFWVPDHPKADVEAVREGLAALGADVERLAEVDDPDVTVHRSRTTHGRALDYANTNIVVGIDTAETSVLYAGGNSPHAAVRRAVASGEYEQLAGWGRNEYQLATNALKRRVRDGQQPLPGDAARPMTLTPDEAAEVGDRDRGFLGRLLGSDGPEEVEADAVGEGDLAAYADRSGMGHRTVETGARTYDVYEVDDGTVAVVDALPSDPGAAPPEGVDDVDLLVTARGTVPGVDDPDEALAGTWVTDVDRIGTLAGESDPGVGDLKGVSDVRVLPRERLQSTPVGDFEDGGAFVSAHDAPSLPGDRAGLLGIDTGDDWVVHASRGVDPGDLAWATEGPVRPDCLLGPGARENAETIAADRGDGVDPAPPPVADRERIVEGMDAEGADGGDRELEP